MSFHALHGGKRIDRGADASAAREREYHYRRADAAVHAAGLVAVAAGCLALALSLPNPPGWRPGIAIGLYALGLVASFGFSAAYNTAAPGPRREVLRRFDHAAIFLMIAGTYSPVSLLAIGGWLGTALLGFVWAGALLGATLKLLAPGRFERLAIGAYLLLGWVGIVAAAPLVEALASWQLGALLAGGIFYSAGVLVHLATRLPYNTALWHALVLVAAGCHYTVVLRLAAG